MNDQPNNDLPEDDDEAVALIEANLRRSVAAGHMTEGVDADGNPTFSLTDEGKRYLESGFGRKDPT